MKGDERVYHEGFADLGLAMIPKLKIVNQAFFIESTKHRIGKCLSKLLIFIKKVGAPGRTRTCNPRLRRPMLYPVELRAL